MRRTEEARTAAVRRKVYSAAACSKAMPTAMSAAMSAATCSVTPAAAPPAAASAGICFEREKRDDEKRDDEEQHRNASTGRQHRSCCATGPSPSHLRDRLRLGIPPRAKSFKC